jgi:prepilin signal peptidase PulO-like enzyme (type II secretory pathway)
MTHLIQVFADGGLFATLAYLGTVLGRLVTDDARSFADGPPPGRPAIWLIVCVAALAGIGVGVRGVTVPELGMASMLTIALAGICYADIRCGLIPDVFTLAPLAAVLAGDLLLHQWSAPIAVALVAAPFGIAAKFSQGRGMGWGDVKLVALGAAVLGAQPALLAFSGACFAAVAVALVRRRREPVPSPIAFAPYLVCCIAAVLAIHGVSG